MRMIVLQLAAHWETNARSGSGATIHNIAVNLAFAGLVPKQGVPREEDGSVVDDSVDRKLLPVAPR